eukprot:GHVS01099696.1.p2 GENE.GHVS01099696.1~~GHVS01099696.1.p2  ORF type:complete len:106 (-),score=22.57 GHVS01099696.1:797-1114(-)
MQSSYNCVMCCCPSEPEHKLTTQSASLLTSSPPTADAALLTSYPTTRTNLFSRAQRNILTVADGLGVLVSLVVFAFFFFISWMFARYVSSWAAANKAETATVDEG